MASLGKCLKDVRRYHKRIIDYSSYEIPYYSEIDLAMPTY